MLVPVFNEEEVVEYFISTVNKILSDCSFTYEFIFINDGSTDKIHEILKEKISLEPRIKIINLSINFGKEQALSAGLDHASGSAVIPLDCYNKPDTHR